MQRRLYGIGDIHGHLDKLQQMVEKIEPDERTTLVFLGDYINYGEDSKGVIDYLIQLREWANCIFLKGDCEAMFLEALTLDETPVFQFIRRGGDKTWRSYGGCMNTVPDDHLAFLESLKCSHSEGKFHFVHAGVRPGVPLEKQKELDMLWIRDEFIYGENLSGKVVVSGHTPTRNPRRTSDDKIFLDTGAAWPHFQGFGKLTACEVHSGVFISV